MIAQDIEKVLLSEEEIEKPLCRTSTSNRRRL